MSWLQAVTYRGPESPLIDCWTVGAQGGAVIEGVTLAARSAAIEAVATDAARGAEFARWIESEECLDDRTDFVPSYGHALTTAHALTARRLSNRPGDGTLPGLDTDFIGRFDLWDQIAVWDSAADDFECELANA